VRGIRAQAIAEGGSKNGCDTPRIFKKVKRGRRDPDPSKKNTVKGEKKETGKREAAGRVALKGAGKSITSQPEG